MLLGNFELKKQADQIPFHFLTVYLYVSKNKWVCFIDLKKSFYSNWFICLRTSVNPYDVCWTEEEQYQPVFVTNIHHPGFYHHTSSC